MNIKGLLILLYCILFNFCLSANQKVVLNYAELEVAQDDKLVLKSAEVLKEEIFKRTGLKLGANLPFTVKIILGTESAIISKYSYSKKILDKYSATNKDGYKVVYDKSSKQLYVVGHDPRGVLYGVGYLLRKMELSKAEIVYYSDNNISSSPVAKYRGVGLNGNPKFRDDVEKRLAHFDQYVRELALFGANCIDMTRGNSVEMAEICLSYGLDIGIVSFNEGPDFISKEGIQNELDKRENIFKSQPVINNWTAKSGDPGHLDVPAFLNFTEQEARLLRKYHPNAKVWIAPQKVSNAPESYFSDVLKAINNSPWIDGVLYGPWARFTFEDFRERVSPDKEIRHFSDIGHIYACQYPVEALDLPMAISYGRIMINPRPEALKVIHNRVANQTAGSLTYTEGTNDDVNKFLWLAQDWNPNTDAEIIIRDYSRFFIGPSYESIFTQGILLNEKSMIGKVLDNVNIDKSYELWKGLESHLNNKNDVYDIVRFRMGLLRGYSDKYVKERYKFELQQEKILLNELIQVQDASIFQEVRNRYNQANTNVEFIALKNKCEELYNLVYKGIDGEWSIEHQEIRFFKQMNVPLNNREWFNAKFSALDFEYDDKRRQKLANKLIKDAQPAFYNPLYFNLGNLDSESVTKTFSNWRDDPYYLKSPYVGYGVRLDYFTMVNSADYKGRPIHTDWLTQVGVYYDRPLTLSFSGLDSDKRYKLKVVYIGEGNVFRVNVGLKANDKYVVHQPIKLNLDQYVYEFDLPKELYNTGKITLTWQAALGERAVNVAAVSFELID